MRNTRNDVTATNINGEEQDKDEKGVNEKHIAVHSAPVNNFIWIKEIFLSNDILL